MGRKDRKYKLYLRITYAMNTLQVIQIICLTVMATLALMLFFSGFSSPSRNKEYEGSRWLMFSAALLLAVHYALQFKFGIRATHVDMGVAVNILFYTPVTFLTALAISNMTSDVTVMRNLTVMAAIIMGLECLIFLTGMLTGVRFRPGFTLYAMYLLFLISITYCITQNIRGFKRTQKALDRDHGNPADAYASYMRSGAVVLCLTAMLTPLFILGTKALYFFTPLAMGSFIYFFACFIGLGHDLKGVMETISSEKTSSAKTKMTESRDIVPANESHEGQVTDKACEKRTVEEIDNAIRIWREGRGFSNPELSISSFAREIGICRRQLSPYFGSHLGCTFRSWITSVRVEEAKKIILSNPDMKAEAVAETCGFSSRSFFQTSFKNITGMTPMEWLKMH